MKSTLFFDLDGTLVDMSSLSSGKLEYFASASLLGTLKKKYRLGIISGAPRKELNAILRATRWQKFFFPEYTITASEVWQPKITGIPFDRAKRMVSGPAIMVGDSIKDVVGSKKAGLPCVRVRRSRNPRVQARYLRMAILRAEALLAFAR